MFALLATALLARQNPLPPYVELPKDWDVVYFRGVGREDTFLKGPEGEAIQFPPYGQGGVSAAEVHRRDPQAMFVSAFMGGRVVEAAITKDGALTVSLGRRQPEEHGSDHPVTYTTHATTARQTAVAVGIVLTRLRAFDRDPNRSQYPKRSPDTPAPRVRLPGDPFPGSVSLPEGYAFRKAPVEGYRIGTFESPQGPPFSLWRMFLIDPGPWRTPKPGDGTWQETAPILDGWLTVRSDAKGALKAGFDRLPPKPRSATGPIFVAASATPQTVFAAIFAALTYTSAKDEKERQRAVTAFGLAPASGGPEISTTTRSRKG